MNGISPNYIKPRSLEIDLFEDAFKSHKKTISHLITYLAKLSLNMKLKAYV